MTRPTWRIRSFTWMPETAIPAFVGRGVGLGLALLLLVLPVRAQIFKIPAPDTSAGLSFGVAVAVNGDRAVVGASAENICGPNSGAAYIYERDSAQDTWHQVAKLRPRDCVAGDFFGHSLSLSGDRAIIAASGAFPSRAASNAAYIFEREPATGEWSQTAKLTNDSEVEEGSFSASVSIDGDRALVTTSGDPIRHEYSGAAYVFERKPNGNWVKTARLSGSGSIKVGVFGGSGALDGNVAVVSASLYYDNRPGSIYIFEHDPATGHWQEVRRFGDIDDLFISLDVDQGRVLVGESQSGRNHAGTASLFERDANGTWHKTATLRPKVPYDSGLFGSAVAFDGGSALVAGYDEQLGKNFNIDRVVYEFRRDDASESWSQRRIFDVGAVAFGTAIATGGDFAVIGQSSDQTPGAVYVVRLR